MSGEPRLTAIKGGDSFWMSIVLQELKDGEDPLIASAHADLALDQLRKRVTSPPSTARLRWLVALLLVLSVLIGATTFLVVSSISSGPQPLYVCCTAAGGCVVGPPSQCAGEIYWCEVGESTEANGLPAIVCHDGEGEP